MKALVIEPNEDIVANLSLCLQVRWPGISIVSADGGDKGVELVESESPDIVIVDLDQSRSDRFAVMRDIRYVSNVPIVALSELGADMDKARGLEHGADEYITKPFSPIEFLARVRALLRRVNHAELVTRDSVYSFGELSMNFVTREVRIGKDLVRLTPTEYKLLYYLVRNVGKIVSRRALVEKVWGPEYLDQTDYLRKYVHRLRKKLKCGLDSPHNILTEQGQGYRFIHRDLASFQDRYRQ